MITPSSSSSNSTPVSIAGVVATSVWPEGGSQPEAVPGEMQRLQGPRLSAPHPKTLELPAARGTEEQGQVSVRSGMHPAAVAVTRDGPPSTSSLTAAPPLYVTHLETTPMRTDLAQAAGAKAVAPMYKWNFEERYKTELLEQMEGRPFPSHGSRGHFCGIYFGNY